MYASVQIIASYLSLCSFSRTYNRIICSHGNGPNVSASAQLNFWDIAFFASVPAFGVLLTFSTISDEDRMKGDHCEKIW